MRKPNEVWQKAALFAQLWEEIYREKFIITGMELKWAKELVGVDNDLIVERFKIFKGDEWYGENARHSLPSFVKNFNTFVKKTRRADGTWKTEEPMPIREVSEMFKPIGEMLSVRKTTDKNSGFNCPRCGGIHSAKFIC
jgi:hypothetical protein